MPGDDVSLHNDSHTTHSTSRGERSLLKASAPGVGNLCDLRCARGQAWCSEVKWEVGEPAPTDFSWETGSRGRSDFPIITCCRYSFILSVLSFCLQSYCSLSFILFTLISTTWFIQECNISHVSWAHHSVKIFFLLQSDNSITNHTNVSSFIPKKNTGVIPRPYAPVLSTETPPPARYAPIYGTYANAHACTSRCAP